jgi:hypothetical protein
MQWEKRLPQAEIAFGPANFLCRPGSLLTALEFLPD